MACGNVNRCNQRYHDNTVQEYAMNKPYFREEIVKDLRMYGTSVRLLVSDSQIPRNVDVVYSPYDDTAYPVLRLQRFLCPLDNVLTSRIDWTDIEPGTYVEDRFLLKITILGDSPVTADESNNPRKCMSEVHGYRLKVETFGTVDAEWKVDEKGRMYPARFSSYETSPKGMGAVHGVATVETKVYDLDGNILEHTIVDREGNELEELPDEDIDAEAERVFKALMRKFKLL